MKDSIYSIISQFNISGSLVDVQPFGPGHINDTFQIRYEKEISVKSYILQKINQQVFKKPVHVMENIQRVTEHLREKHGKDKEKNINRSTLTIVTTLQGYPYYQDNDGEYWRVYRFIDNTRSYDTVETAEQAFEAGRIFGEFQRDLADFPPPRLHDTIPGFHDTPQRFKRFQNVLENNSLNRAKEAKVEIDFALKNSSIIDILQDLLKRGDIPERVTHNDTKINNILFDHSTGKALCVIDLDTVMQGMVLYDIGDLIRTTVSKHKEDEKDLSRVKIDKLLFESLIKGYISTAHDFLNRVEKDYLLFGGILITYEQGLRFLTDYLSGDIYYKTHYQEQNLDRTKTQFTLVQELLNQQEELNRFIRSMS